MAHLHNFSRRQRSTSWMSDIGNKVRNVADSQERLTGSTSLARQPIRASKPWVPWWQRLGCYCNIFIILIYSNVR